MVDPNRKINRLTDKDIEFLDECEELFANRFTEEDEDFMQHCSKPLADPPIVENWGFSGGHQNNRSGSGHRHFHPYGGGRGGGDDMRNNRGWSNRGGDRRNRRNFGHASRNGPYQSRREQDDGRRRFNDNRGEEVGEHNRPPMNVRKDYGNFVAASKD